MRRAAATALAALALILASPAGAAGPAESVAAAGARVGAAMAAAAAPTPAAVEELAAALFACATALYDLRASAAEAEARAARLDGALQARRVEIGRLLATLEAFSRAQGEAGPSLHPGGPAAAAQARMMLETLSPALAVDASALAAQMKELAAARQVAARGLDSLGQGLAQLDAGRATLIAALAKAPDAEPAPTPAVAREAETLTQLADRLGGPASGEDAAMDLLWPVVGATPRSGFREPDASGARLPGLRLEAAPLSLVAAPAAGRVLYAGPFLEYGYVVVLGARADVQIVLAGLATLAVEPGQELRRGALLGLLGGRPLDAQEFLMAGTPGNGETRTETLYIELRHGRGPVDPAPWFQGRNG